jgi:hypothetical protein
VSLAGGADPMTGNAPQTAAPSKEKGTKDSKKESKKDSKQEKKAKK